ncbi:MAG: hypothetical protein NVS3B3_09280 [Aquirhabdus sp.]
MPEFSAAIVALGNLSNRMIELTGFDPPKIYFCGGQFYLDESPRKPVEEIES